MIFSKKFFKKKINIVILGFLLLILYIIINNKSIKEGYSASILDDLYCNKIGSGFTYCGDVPHQKLIGTCAYNYGPLGACHLSDASCNDLYKRCVDGAIPDAKTPSGNVADQVTQETCSIIQATTVANAVAAQNDCSP